MASTRTLLTLLAAAAVLAIGCGASTQPPEAVGDISFARGGGLAGDTFALEIDPEGQARLIIQQGISERLIEFEVSAPDLAELVEHLEAADISDLGQSRSETCADCFGYSLEFGDAAASADSGTITEEFSAAADPLERLLRDHLPKDARY